MPADKCSQADECKHSEIGPSSTERGTATVVDNWDLGAAVSDDGQQSIRIVKIAFEKGLDLCL